MSVTQYFDPDGAMTPTSPGLYHLSLYVTGSTARSMRALANVKQICEEHLGGQYRLEVIDLYQQPALASAEQILAAPTLVKKSPLPLRRIIGDMSDQQRVLRGLGVAVPTLQ
jgi:circadian clock protein KaiB